MIFIQTCDTKKKFDSLIERWLIKFFQNVQRKKIKDKKLIIRRIVKISVTALNHETIKIMLNCDSEVNLIKKYFVRKLNLKACALNGIDLITFDNKSLQTHEIYFLIITIKDLTETKRFFEKFFLTMNIDDDLIFNMFWFELVNFDVNWINWQLNWWIN